MGDARALHLLVHNAHTNKFELGEEALAKLRALRGPVGVVAVCGRARQGKSFLLNQLIGRSNGFKVGPTQRPCTKGLWMWSEPVPMTAKDGSRFHMVLLDCEGIDAYDQTGSYSVQLFSLAVLCSSLFLYNQMGGIDEAALERLQLIVEMTKHIKVRAGRGGGAHASAVNELAAYTPSFFWLLRDFYLDLSDGGRKITPTQYLETALAPLPGHSEAVRSKNTIRKSIKQLFPDRECFALVRPADEESVLRNLDSAPLSQLRPQFLAGLKNLTDRVFSNAAPKTMNSTALTGTALASLISAYVDAINNGAVPTITTAWQNVVETECRRAADAAQKAYEEAFDLTVGADEEALGLAHRRAVAAAQAAFEELAFGDGPGRHAYEKRVQEIITEKFNSIRSEKFAEAEAQVSSALGAAAEQLDSMVDDGESSVEDMVSEMNRLIAAITASTAGGPHRFKSLVNFFGARFGPLLIKASQRQAERFQRQLEEVEARARAEAEGRMEQELTKVVSEAENSATVAAEEAYLGMLCDFCERLGTDNPDVPLLPEPSTANSIQIKLKSSALGIGSTSLFRENYNDSSSHASMGSVDGDVLRSLELGGSMLGSSTPRQPLSMLNAGGQDPLGHSHLGGYNNKAQVSNWVDSASDGQHCIHSHSEYPAHEPLLFSAGKSSTYAASQSAQSPRSPRYANSRLDFHSSASEIGGSTAKRPVPVQLSSHW